MLFFVVGDVKVCLEERKKMNMQKEINKFLKKHGDLYDYSLVNYVNNITKVKIICKIHGVFEQTPHNHKRLCGCPKCNKGGSDPLSVEDFIKKSISKHGNLYDYSLVEYKNNRKKIKIICKIHGRFEQIAGSHLNGKGCRQCSLKHLDKFDLIKRFNKKNNHYKYNLENEKYNIKDIIEIICPIHGEFKQRISAHFISGCQKCAGRIDNNYDFEKKGIYTHGDLYDYSLVEYINHKTPVSIICKKHGIFRQKPYIHFSGSGCSFCNESRGEKSIRNILISKDIEFLTQKKFSDCLHKTNLRFDFYIPKLNMCIEYNGRQHYEPVDRFGGYNYLIDLRIKDEIKKEYCLINNIKLLVIKYTDYNNIEEVISNIL